MKILNAIVSFIGSIINSFIFVVGLIFLIFENEVDIPLLKALLALSVPFVKFIVFYSLIMSLIFLFLGINNIIDHSKEKNNTIDSRLFNLNSKIESLSRQIIELEHKNTNYIKESIFEQDSLSETIQGINQDKEIDNTKPLPIKVFIKTLEEAYLKDVKINVSKEETNLSDEINIEFTKMNIYNNDLTFENYVIHLNQLKVIDESEMNITIIENNQKFKLWFDFTNHKNIFKHLVIDNQ